MKFSKLWLTLAFAANIASADLPRLGKAAKTTDNPDGSVVLEGPTISRGEETLLISGGSDPKGLCKLLGFESYLESTVAASGDHERTAVVDANARVAGIRAYGRNENNPAITSLSCYNGPLPKLLFRYAAKVENSDGTITFTSPKVLRGSHSVLVSAKATPEGICRGLGYDRLLPQTVKVEGDHELTVVVNGEMTFAGYARYSRHESNQAISSITCYRDEKPVQSVFETTKSPVNSDGSTSLFNPKMKRADGTYLFSAKSDLSGVCRAFGFSYVLASTVIYAGDHEITIVLDKNASFAAFARYNRNESNRAIDHVACYNGNAPHLVRGQQQLKQNSDGSTTIVGPKASRGPWTYLISYQSTPESVCKLFGFSKFLSETWKVSGDHEMTTRLNASGEWANYDRYSRNSSNGAVDRLTCYD